MVVVCAWPQQAFLTGSMQNFARKHKYPIDTIDFDFIMTDTPWEELRSKPEDGVYIRGLFLEGARWDPVAKSLGDSKPKQLYTAMPVIHLSPVQHRKEPKSGIYRCPVYKVLSRRGGGLFLAAVHACLLYAPPSHSVYITSGRGLIRRCGLHGLWPHERSGVVCVQEPCRRRGTQPTSSCGSRCRQENRFS
jgi:hypothetical protein